MVRYLILPLLLLVQYAAAEEWRILLDHPSESLNPEEEIIMSKKLKDIDMTRYLRDVIKLLRRDPKFFDKVEKEFEKDGYVDGWTANSLNELKPEVKGILDELKRIELQRILKYKSELEKKGMTHEKVMEMVKAASGHLDIYSTDTFTPHDLRNLFGETVWHMEEDPQFRRNHFKYYEMHKQLELEELLSRLEPKEQEEIKKNIEDLHKYHKSLGHMHLPLSPDHLKEIWVFNDRMDVEKFNIKTFFHMHDINGDHFWDEHELKILLERELNKMYDKFANDYDANEKQEEMDRMMEYIMKEVDMDDDRLLELHEVAEHLERVDYTAMWEDIFDTPQFSEQEYELFKPKHVEEVNRMIDRGLITLPHSGVVKHITKKAELVRKKK